MAKQRAGIEPPSRQELRTLLGPRALAAWEALTDHVGANYPGFAQLWNANNRAGAYELKYRRSGKTLCAFYARERHFGFMVIFGKQEQEKFEAARHGFSAHIEAIYDNSKTYHDGKWMMFEVRGKKGLDGLAEILAIKKAPGGKPTGATDK